MIAIQKKKSKQVKTVFFDTLYSNPSQKLNLYTAIHIGTSVRTSRRPAVEVIRPTPTPYGLWQLVHSKTKFGHSTFESAKVEPYLSWVIYFALTDRPYTTIIDRKPAETSSQ